MATFLITLVAAGLALELGYFIGGWDSRKHPDASRSMLGPVLAAHLGLLAFMLAFTFGFAASRLAERKLLVITEANAIGTAALRATVLPEPHASRVQSVLYDYTKIRAVLVPEKKMGLGEAKAQSQKLLRELWQEAHWAAEQGVPNAPVAALFMDSVNTVIDTGTQRETVLLVHRIPRLIWICLSLIGVLGAVLLGYQGGRSDRAHAWVAVPLMLAFAVVMVLLVEMDSPFGALQLSQEAMLQTLESLRSPAP